ncbi:hypothetical protein H6F43_21680, partial [Leptolyngbya sp. FACHB-36]|nr:hypothetical protein [Leptolyngbya sp. FACHB-36]
MNRFLDQQTVKRMLQNATSTTEQQKTLGQDQILRLAFWLLAIVLGGLQAGANSYKLSSEDSISYLDVADAYLRGDWTTAINAYWSPLYSWLLGLVRLVLQPSPAWEFATVKLTNGLIYLGALASFEVFLHEFIASYRRSISSDSRFLQIPDWAWRLLGYSLFLWAALVWSTLHSDTPDLCTTALIYLAAGILLRLQQSPTWAGFAMLGAVLGLGYLTKAVVLPLTVVFLGVSAFSAPFRQVLPKLLAAVLAFMLIAAPFITALSFSKGRLTIGDTGRLNAAWTHNPDLLDRVWLGEPPENGTPLHPPRTVFADPEAYEFATPIVGTYPLWTDASYWNDGLKPTFNLGRQLRIIAKNLVFYTKQFLGFLVLSYLLLICAGGTLKPSLRSLRQGWRFLVPALAGLSAYLVIIDLSWAAFPAQPSTRYIASFISLVVAGVFFSVRLPNTRRSRQLLLGFVIAVLVLVGGRLTYQGVQNLAAVLKLPENTAWTIARSAQQVGIQPGSPIAILGPDPSHQAWARLARVRIIAQIPNA